MLLRLDCYNSFLIPHAITCSFYLIGKSSGLLSSWTKNISLSLVCGLIIICRTSNTHSIKSHWIWCTEINWLRLNKPMSISQKRWVCDCKRMKGVEPSSPAWKAGVIAVIRHPQKYEATILKNTGYVNRNFNFNSCEDLIPVVPLPPRTAAVLCRCDVSVEPQRRSQNYTRMYSFDECSASGGVDFLSSLFKNWVRLLLLLSIITISFLI